MYIYLGVREETKNTEIIYFAWKFLHSTHDRSSLSANGFISPSSPREVINIFILFVSLYDCISRYLSPAIT